VQRLLFGSGTVIRLSCSAAAAIGGCLGAHLFENNYEKTAATTYLAFP